MAQAPNILVFVIDSQRVSNLSVYGYSRHTTPHIETVAAEGVVMENHIATSPWCLGSYASLHTGKYPSSHGASVRFECLTSEFPTLAAVLSRHNYVTAGFSSSSYMSELVGLHRGFQHFEFFKGDAEKDEDKGSAELERRVRKWLTGVDPARPFFLFINCNEPHWPYYAPEPYRFLFIPPGHGRNEPYFHDLVQRARIRRDMAEKPMTEEDWVLLKGLYDGETARADGALGGVLDAVRSRGLLDTTMVVVTADHGEDQGEHLGFLSHGYCLYRTVLHIPLVIRFPGRIAAGTRFPGLTQPVDLFPTFLTLASLDDEEWHEGLQGVSLFPAFDQTPVREVAIAEYAAPLQALERDLRDHPVPSSYARRFHRSLKSIEDPRFRFIWSSDGHDEFYDIQSDPLEKQNLIEGQPPEAMALYRRLDDWLMRHPHRDYGDALNIHPLKGVSPASLRRLEAWGLLRRIHELPFGSGEHLSETIDR